ncbi:MAG TPA: thiamine phosphate synthase, partial [Polyangiaceae bacterium]
MRGLYPIIDLDSLTALKLDPLEFAHAVLTARPELVQLRAKHASPRETLTLLRALRPACTRAGSLLFANDRPDLALLADCDGVHVGQDDLSVTEVRRIGPRLRIGVSTHNPVELEQALQAKPSYVAFGPVFATRSKGNPDPVVGFEALLDAAQRARAAGCALVAIGGVDLEHASQIQSAEIAGAVIGGLLPPDGDIEKVATLAQSLQSA